jgi:NADPH2:quinone reductase
MMKVVEISSVGGPEVLRVVERPRPTPGPGEVLIKVAAAGINRADILQRIGKHAPPQGVTDIPGLEVSGTIEETGPNIPSMLKGRKVCALLEGGGYAEYAIAKAELCLPIAESLDLTHAAGVPEAIFTVTRNIFQCNCLPAGCHLLVHGGASGIGTMAIQMAKTRGIRISVTAGSDERCAACLDLGADRAINYKTEDFVEVLKDDPACIVLDMVGGDYLPRNLAVLKQGGRHFSIAWLRGAKTELDISLMMRKNLTLSGSMLRHEPLSVKERCATLIQEMFWSDVLAGRIGPIIAKTFPLEKAAEAHAFFSEGTHIGKILLTVS